MKRTQPPERPPELSVVMPARNAGRFIDEAIGSILSQTFADFELIICDDNSTDTTAEKIAKWADRDTRIRAFWSDQYNSPARAGNWCVSLARGDIVARMDADDIAHPERLARQLAVIHSAPDIALVGALYNGIDRHSKTIYRRDRSSLTSTRINPPCGHGSAMFRKSAFEAAGGYRVACDYWEDFDLIQRLTCVGRIFYLPDELYSYRHSAGHARVQADQLRIERALDLSARCQDNLASGKPYDAQLAASKYPAQTRVNLRVFSTIASLHILAGDRPRILRRMLKRGKLHSFGPDLIILIFLLWGTLSPKSLRWFRAKLKARKDRSVADEFRDGVPVEWYWSKKRAAIRDASAGQAQPAGHQIDH